MKNWLIRKDPNAVKDWGQEKKGTTGDESVRWWHHWLDGHEFGQALGVGDGQGSLACWGPWGRRVGHDWTTELNWILSIWISVWFIFLFCFFCYSLCLTAKLEESQFPEWDWIQTTAANAPNPNHETISKLPVYFLFYDFYLCLKKSEFILWSNSLAQQLLSPHSKITELELWDSQITNRRQCCNPWSLDAQNLFTITEALTQRNLLAAFRESPCAATKTQCNQKLKTIIRFKILSSSLLLFLIFGCTESLLLHMGFL